MVNSMMGYWQVIHLLIFSSSLLLSDVHGESLDDLLHAYANTTLSKHRTGSFFEVVLPSTFSGMEVSVVRLRSSSFWRRGVDFGCFHVPKRVLPITYAERIAIVYENLGSWSTYFFQPPTGTTFIAPVIGFEAYDATDASSLGATKLTFIVTGGPILINFTSIMISHNTTDLMPNCVKFSNNGSVVESTNMTKPNVCFTEDSGHFSVVIPSPTTMEMSKKKDERVWRWWVVGLAAGFAFLGLLFVIVMVVVKQVKKKKVRKMEEEAEKGVTLDRIYIGSSVMPRASMIRTQSSIEDDLVP